MSKADLTILYQDGDSKSGTPVVPMEPFEFAVELRRWESKSGVVEYVIETEYTTDQKAEGQVEVDVEIIGSGCGGDVSLLGGAIKFNPMGISAVTPVFSYKRIRERTVIDAQTDGEAIRLAVMEYHALKDSVEWLKEESKPKVAPGAETPVEEEQ